MGTAVSNVNPGSKSLAFGGFVKVHQSKLLFSGCSTFGKFDLCYVTQFRRVPHGSLC